MTKSNKTANIISTYAGLAKHSKVDNRANIPINRKPYSKSSFIYASAET